MFDIVQFIVGFALAYASCSIVDDINLPSILVNFTSGYPTTTCFCTKINYTLWVWQWRHPAKSRGAWKFAWTQCTSQIIQEVDHQF